MDGSISSFKRFLSVLFFSSPFLSFLFISWPAAKDYLLVNMIGSLFNMGLFGWVDYLLELNVGDTWLAL